MSSTLKKIKLKRCPFCGGKARVETQNMTPEFGYKKYRVFCLDCDLWIESKVLKTAVNKWNTRKADENEDTFVEVGGVWIRKVKEENKNEP